MDKSVYEFISKNTNDPIIQRNTCTISGEQFPIYQSDSQFYTKISPTFDGQTFSIPFPTLSPEERRKRRLIRRNERNFYRTTCYLTQKPIITMYNPILHQRVISDQAYRSDNHDPLQYGIDFDFSKPFFEQFEQLINDVPKLNLVVNNNHNSPYVNYEAEEKDCYMTIGWHRNENCMYGNYFIESKDSIDGYRNFDVTQCYESIEWHTLHKCKYTYKAEQSNNCILCYNIRNCSYCFGCVNLQNKSYYFFNQQYTPEQRQEKVDQYKIHTHTGLQKAKNDFMQFVAKFPRPAVTQNNSENCTGSNIYNAKNCHFCHVVEEAEDCRYGAIFGYCKDVYDTDSNGLSELSYEVLAVGWTSKASRNQRLMFSVMAIDANNIRYSFSCLHSNNCFGCVWLKKHQYCIFNKQYTPEEYEKEVAKIITHMIQTGERWQFFPVSLSPFAYNETTAQDFFPLTQEQTLQKGHRRQDIAKIAAIPEGIHIIEPQQVPEDITSFDYQWPTAIRCQESGRGFILQKTEVEFYKTHNIPLPKFHPDIRHQNRLKHKHNHSLYLRNCDKTGEPILSIYPTDTPYQVWSKKSYDQQVYW